MKMPKLFMLFLLIAAVSTVVARQQGGRGQRGQDQTRFNAGDRVADAPAGNSRPFCCDYTSRPPLFFRETFDADIPNETPITQKSITNPNVILSTWGPGKAGIRRSHHTFPADDPKYTFSGPAYNVDLSKVDEIGYSDLMTGGDVSDAPSGAAASRVDWIEVWGFPIARTAAAKR